MNGIKVNYVTVAEPGLKEADSRNFSSGYQSDTNVFHRWVGDKRNQTYFGYDLTVAAMAGTIQCRVSVLPLTITAAEIAKETHSEVAASWRPLNLPRYPATQTVGPGDTIALDLLVSPDGKQKIVDYFRTSCGKGVSQAEEEAPARDFTFQDVKLNIDHALLYQDGQPVSGPTAGDASAASVWFSFPGKGRFLVSLTPHDGYDFQKLGTIRKDHLSFQAGGTRYEVRALHEMLGNGKVWNAYVLFDRAYPLKGTNAEMGGGDSVEKVLEGR